MTLDEFENEVVTTCVRSQLVASVSVNGVGIGIRLGRQTGMCPILAR